LKPKVFITIRLPKQTLELIGSKCSIEAWDAEDAVPRDVLLQKVSEIEGLVEVGDGIDAELLNHASKLRVISNFGVGVDNIDIGEATRRGIIVGNTPGVLTETTADLAFSLMLAAARRIVEGAEGVKGGRWGKWGPMNLLGVDVHGATLGIIGLGRIGSAVARRGRGFGMNLAYYSRERHMEIENEIGIKFMDFNALLGECDFLSIHTRLTPETYHLIGEKEFLKMKPNLILVNTSRGAVVDSKALYEALSQHKIAYAALDVTDPEPIPPNHPLLKLDNTLITPHIGSASMATRIKMGSMVAENLFAGLNGELPPNPVNPEALSRKTSPN
jgi:glyoxylate reductase